jgi:hypothetical protein
VTPPYLAGIRKLSVPFSAPVSEPFFRLLRFFNRRLARLARLRLRAGTYGRRNAGRADLLPGFALGPSNLKWIPKCLVRLLALEIRSIPDYLRARRRQAVSPMPVAGTASSRQELGRAPSSGA